MRSPRLLVPAGALASAALAVPPPAAAGINGCSVERSGRGASTCSYVANTRRGAITLLEIDADATVFVVCDNGVTGYTAAARTTDGTSTYDQVPGMACEVELLVHSGAEAKATATQVLL